MANIKKVRPYGYYDRALQKHFATNREKRDYLKAHGFRESGDMESDKKRTARNVAIVNEARRKQGLKPKTAQELVGDSRKIPGKTVYFY
jgi:hypothetical protein